MLSEIKILLPFKRVVPSFLNALINMPLLLD